MNRTRIGLTLAIAGLAIACSEPPVGPPAADAFEPAAVLTPGVHVLNTQLRGIINPDIEPSPAWGHIQIKLTDDGADGYRVEWKGRIFNPDAETLISGGIVYGGPDATLIPGTPIVFSLFRDSSESCDILNFDSQAITDEEHMPADIAQAMMLDPDLFAVVVFSPEGPRVAGLLGMPDPTEVIAFNPQPDPPGKIVRCDAVGTV